MTLTRVLVAAVAAVAAVASGAAAGPVDEEAASTKGKSSMMCCYTLETQAGKVEHVLRGGDQGCPSAETVHCEELGKRPVPKKQKGGMPESTEDREKRLKSPVAAVYVGHLTTVMCEQIAVATNAIGKWPTDEGKPHGCVGVHADATKAKVLQGVQCSAIDAKPRDGVARSTDAKGCLAHGAAKPSAEEAIADQAVLPAAPKADKAAIVRAGALNPATE